MKIGLVLSLAVALGACVPYPAELLQDDGKGNSQYALTSGAYTGLDDGATEVDSIHFKVHAYGSTFPKEVSDASEQSFARILMDTGLSFQPRATYDLLVYGTQDEYRKKTGQPDWSTSVTIGNSIYTFSSPILNGVVAHAVVHVIWLDYMNGRLSDQQRWVDEGFAMYEEIESRPRGASMYSNLQPMLRTLPMPMDQLQNMAPGTERGYDTSLWYAESESLVRFMIERGGRIGFGQFLTSIQINQSFDAAIYSGFPGQWQTLDAFYTAWKASFQ